jgi:hypothetical protein
METQRSYSASEKRLLTLVPAAMFLVVIIATSVVLAAANAMQSGRASGRVASAAQATTTHVSLDILPVKPGGPAEDWPAYMASSPTTIPANTLVTVTIRNFDLGDDTMPADSPLLRVQGTTNGVATADGKAYSALVATHVSHTFTIPQLHLNVPIPGDPVGDASNVSVTFTFRTPARAGTYTFQCFVPCGTGSAGFDGPMSTMGYMRGTLTVA